MKTTLLLLVVSACYVLSAAGVGAQQPVTSSGPALLTYDEIIQLYQQDVPPAPLNDKLRRLLTTPFVSNAAFDAGVRPMKPSSPQLGKFLRVAEWNIERGLEFDAVRLAFTDPRAFALLMDQKGSTSDPDDYTSKPAAPTRRIARSDQGRRSSGDCRRRHEHLDAQCRAVKCDASVEAAFWERSLVG